MSGKECRMQFEKQISVLGHGINLNVYDTGAGINILIEGGERGHIGAVAVAKAGALLESVTFPSHKETVVCERWAREVSAVYGGPVVVEAGIHYDGITGAQIREVLEALDGELEELLSRMKGNTKKEKGGTPK